MNPGDKFQGWEVVVQDRRSARDRDMDPEYLRSRVFCSKDLDEVKDHLHRLITEMCCDWVGDEELDEEGEDDCYSENGAHDKVAAWDGVVELTMKNYQDPSIGDNYFEVHADPCALVAEVVLRPV